MTPVADYALTTPQDEAPTGVFLLPVCTTRERLLKILNAIKTYEVLSNDRDFNAQIDILEALAYMQDPESAPCFPVSNCDEDTLADSLLQFVDDIISEFREGGIVKAIGYAIDELGRIVVETAIKVIEITVIGLAVAGTLSIIIGGATVATIAVPAGAIITPIFDTGSTAVKVIEFLLEVA